MTQAATLAQLASSGALTADTFGNVGVGGNNAGSYGNLAVLGSSYRAVSVQSTDASGVIAILAANSSNESRVGNVSNHPLWFMVNNDAKARIDTSGNFLVGTASNIISSLSNKVVISDVGGNTEALGTFRSTTAAIGHIGFFNPNGRIGEIFTNGSSTTYSTSSDYRLKENVRPMVGALATVAQLKPCTYTWKIDGSEGQGFIAHELQEIIPDAVGGEKDAVNEDGSIKPQGVDTSFLVATLTAAIQELKAELDVCKAEIAALKGV